MSCRNGCGATFSDRSNRYRHEKKVCVNIISVPMTLSKPHEKIKITIKRKNPTPKRKTEQRSVDNLILEELRALREQVTEMKNNQNMPVVNVSLNNCVIVGADVYQDMVDKLGRDNAIDYLTNENVDEVDVIEKLYLNDQDPSKYSIACHDNRHFRYLNEERQVIDDRGGDKVKQLVESRVHSAMLYASNQRESKVSDNVQDMITGNKGDIIEKLSKVTYNPGHPFFGNQRKSKEPKERKYRVMNGGRSSMAVIVSGTIKMTNSNL